MDRGARHRAGPLPRRGGNRRKKRLTARARWERETGWDYIRSLQDAGRQVADEDYPPRLEWEAPAWRLYELTHTQWRTGFNGLPLGLDYNPALAIIAARGWDAELALALYGAIEAEMLRRSEGD